MSSGTAMRRRACSITDATLADLIACRQLYRAHALVSSRLREGRPPPPPRLFTALLVAFSASATHAHHVPSLVNLQRLYDQPIEPRHIAAMIDNAPPLIAARLLPITPSPVSSITIARLVHRLSPISPSIAESICRSYEGPINDLDLPIASIRLHIRARRYRHAHRLYRQLSPGTSPRHTSAHLLQQAIAINCTTRDEARQWIDWAVESHIDFTRPALSALYELADDPITALLCARANVRLNASMLSHFRPESASYSDARSALAHLVRLGDDARYRRRLMWAYYNAGNAAAAAAVLRDGDPSEMAIMARVHLESGTWRSDIERHLGRMRDVSVSTWHRICTACLQERGGIEQLQAWRSQLITAWPATLRFLFTRPLRVLVHRKQWNAALEEMSAMYAAGFVDMYSNQATAPLIMSVCVARGGMTDPPSQLVQALLRDPTRVHRILWRIDPSLALMHVPPLPAGQISPSTRLFYRAHLATLILYLMRSCPSDPLSVCLPPFISICKAINPIPPSTSTVFRLLRLCALDPYRPREHAADVLHAAFANGFRLTDGQRGKIRLMFSSDQLHPM